LCYFLRDEVLLSDSLDLLLFAADFVLLPSLLRRADEPAFEVDCLVDLAASVLWPDSSLDAGLLVTVSDDLLEAPAL
jgi:hypothetical protein